MKSPVVQTVLVVAVILALAGIAFMESVETELWEAAGSIAEILTLIAIVWAINRTGSK